MSESSRAFEPRRIYLREWRELRALTQQELAARSGVRQSSISQLENSVQGRTSYPSTRRGLPEALSIRPDDPY